MLSFEATDIHERTVRLPLPLSVCIRMEEDVPADDLVAVFPDTGAEELCRVTVRDGETVVFRGIVDEQEHILRATGAFLRISARSAAALLLDNEALPCCYDHPSARLIYERHVRDYGIPCADADDAVYFGELSVSKGMSQWGVLSAFCGACYSSSPRVNADGVLYMKGAPRTGEAVFGGADGIGYTELTDSCRRCDELSRVNVKLTPEDGYGYRVDNRDARQRGIRRERYLNAMLGDKSVRSADSMLERSRQKAHTVSLKCVGRHLTLLGSGARIAGREFEDSFCVCGLKYRMDSKGEYTLIRLRRRTKKCGYPAM